MLVSNRLIALTELRPPVRKQARRQPTRLPGGCAQDSLVGFARGASDLVWA